VITIVNVKTHQEGIMNVQMCKSYILYIDIVCCFGVKFWIPYPIINFWLEYNYECIICPKIFHRISMKIIHVIGNFHIDMYFAGDLYRWCNGWYVRLVCSRSWVLSLLLLLGTQHSGVRAMTIWLEIRIMCQSGATCLPVDCCISDLEL